MVTGLDTVDFGHNFDELTPVQNPHRAEVFLFSLFAKTFGGPSRQFVTVLGHQRMVLERFLRKGKHAPESVGAAKHQRVVADTVIQLTTYREPIIQLSQSWVDCFQFVFGEVAGCYKRMRSGALDQQIQSQSFVDLLRDVCVGITITRMTCRRSTHFRLPLSVAARAEFLASPVQKDSIPA